MGTNYLLYILLANVFLSCDLCLKCSCSFIFLFFLLKLHATKSTTIESYVQASDRRMSEPLESSFFGHHYYFHFFYVLKFLLQYSCFTMLCYLLLYKGNQLHVYIYPFFWGFPSHLGHHRTMSRVPCAIQQVLISYFLYIVAIVHICQSQSPNSSHPTIPPASICLFSVYLFLFYK